MLKENPFKTLAAIFSLIGIIATAVWGAEQRYNQAPQIREMNHIILQDRVQQLEDKIFVLEMKKQSGKASSIDKALLERYKSRLKSLTE